MKKIFKILGAIVIIYLMIKIATRPAIIPEIDDDPTGKMWMQEEKDRAYQEYMSERGL